VHVPELLAHRLLDLAPRRRSGRIRTRGGVVGGALGGSLVVDLASRGLIHVPEGSHEIGGPPVVVVGTAHEELLARALARAQEWPTAAVELVQGCWGWAADSLRGRVVTHPEPGAGSIDVGHIRRVLEDGEAPWPDAAVLISLLEVGQLNACVLGARRGSRRAINRRAAEVLVETIFGELVQPDVARAVRSVHWASWYLTGAGSGMGA
jgi:hypothetical protein